MRADASLGDKFTHFMCEKVLHYCLLCLLGVEDGQTVRMPVGKKEIFITFRVCVHCKSDLKSGQI